MRAYDREAVKCFSAREGSGVFSTGALEYYPEQASYADMFQRP